ncbi:MAG: penicillin-binding protein, partial [Desulfovibrionaceae bacterium]|nr:penicillin-binding protein [Desulfovibrionaceae bacterium]
MGLFAKKKLVKKQGAEYKVLKSEDAGVQAKKFLRLPMADGSRFRIIIGAVLFCVLWAILWCRSLYLQVIAAPELAQRAAEQHEFTEHIQGRRGIITDRNGQAIARSVEAQSVYASPSKIKDPRTVANTLGPILNIEPKDIHARLTKTKRHFIWLKRKVDDKTASQIANLHLSGIGLKTEYTRVYPFKHLAGQLIGFVNTDGKGLEGLERSLDTRLSSPSVEQIVKRDARGKRFSFDGNDQPKAGEDIRLTLDMHVQYMAEEAVAKAVREYDARWGGVIVVDVKNGDILAWAQYPF